ncbi:MAG: hypothetical protein MUC33_01380 [Desulfobacterales bacterium]|jgi:hypothetical protein|nr:hypothetical protein [Desulfobacterales bacterium]MCU0601295.1 hypothetical protein [Desulfobacterales bacterium]
MIKDFNASDDILSSTLLPVVKSGAAPDTNCTSVDGRGFKEVVHVVHLGDSGDTLSGSVKVECELEESDDNSSFTAVPAAKLTNAVSGANTGCFGLIDAPTEDSQFYWTEYRGSKRYTRVVLNFTGTHTSGIPVAAWALRRGPQYLPAIGGAY